MRLILKYLAHNILFIVNLLSGYNAHRLIKRSLINLLNRILSLNSLVGIVIPSIITLNEVL